MMATTAQRCTLGILAITCILIVATVLVINRPSSSQVEVVSEQHEGTSQEQPSEAEQQRGQSRGQSPQQPQGSQKDDTIEVEPPEGISIEFLREDTSLSDCYGKMKGADSNGDDRITAE